MVQIASTQPQHQRRRAGSDTIGQTEKGALLQAAEAICRSNGARLTPIRRRVLEALHASDKPLGAYDLADILNPGGRRLAPITVYRALDFLIAQGLAYRLASLNAFVASETLTASRTAKAFLICQECGSASEIQSPELTETLGDVLGRQGFRSHARVLEITGRCSHCHEVH